MTSAKGTASNSGNITEQVLTASEITENAQELFDRLDADTFPQSRFLRQFYRIKKVF